MLERILNSWSAHFGRILTDAADDFCNIMRLKLRIARIDAFGRECKQKIFIQF